MPLNAICQVGLIGLGEVGQMHLEAYSACSHIHVVAAAEINPDRLANVRSRYDFTGYLSITDMLGAQKLDVVCVLTPASLHELAACLCADAGVPTLCEKPLAHNSQAAVCIRDYFAAKNVPLSYGSSYRHLPAIIAARKLISEGAIGQITLMRETIATGQGPTQQKPLNTAHYPAGGPGGTGMGLVDHGIHLLDIIPWLTGSPIVRATGRGNISGSPLAAEHATLTLANGATAILIYEDGAWPTALPGEGMFCLGAGWDPDGPVPAGKWDPEPGTLHVHGTHGALRICHYANALYLRDASGLRQIPLDGSPAPAHFAAQLEAFAADLRAQRPPSSAPEDGIAALLILEKIYASALL